MGKHKLKPFSGPACGAVCAVLVIAVSVRAAPTTQPAIAKDDAALVYLQAAKAIQVDCPSETAEVFPEYPPYSEVWRTTESATWKANALARQLARNARAIPQATWPTVDQSYFAPLLRLTHELADAALYADYQGNTLEAVEINRDLLHMAELLEDNPRGTMDRVEFSKSIRSYAAVSFLRIASGIVITTDHADGRGMRATDVRELIATLLKQPDPISQIAEVEGMEKKTLAQLSDKREVFMIDFFNRANMQETFAAMSLACHVFKSEKGRWPSSQDELIPAYLPRVTVDPWGDGKKTFGYVLVRGGLPDGSDRPMVYCRCQSKDGLFYYLNGPRYSFSGEGGEHPIYGGQFRDVARWEPIANYTGPTTRPLP